MANSVGPTTDESGYDQICKQVGGERLAGKVGLGRAGGGGEQRTRFRMRYESQGIVACGERLHGQLRALRAVLRGSLEAHRDGDLVKSRGGRNVSSRAARRRNEGNAERTVIKKQVL